MHGLVGIYWLYIFGFYKETQMQLNCLYIFVTKIKTQFKKYVKNEMLYKYKAIVLLKFLKCRLHGRVANLLLGYFQLQNRSRLKSGLSKPCVTCVYSL